MKDTIIKDHQGNENPPEMDFFAWPDTDMGKVFSGTSTKSINDSEKTLKGNRLKQLGCSTIGLVVGITVVFFKFSDDIPMIIRIVFPVLLTCIFYFGSYILSKKTNFCSFICENGYVEYKLATRNNSILKEIVKIDFNKANSLYTSETEEYTNGSYQKTSFGFEWSYYEEDADEARYYIEFLPADKTVSFISSFYIKNKPLEYTEYYVATKLEKMWTLKKIGEIEMDLSSGKIVELIKEPYLIVLSNNEFTLIDNNNRFSRGNWNIIIKKGVITFWDLSERRKLKINSNVSEIPNLNVLLYFMNKYNS